jgi:hypothetical protein
MVSFFIHTLSPFLHAFSCFSGEVTASFDVQGKKIAKVFLIQWTIYITQGLFIDYNNNPINN